MMPGAAEWGRLEPTCRRQLRGPGRCSAGSGIIPRCSHFSGEAVCRTWRRVISSSDIDTVHCPLDQSARRFSRQALPILKHHPHDARKLAPTISRNCRAPTVPRIHRRSKRKLPRLNNLSTVGTFIGRDGTSKARPAVPSRQASLTWSMLRTTLVNPCLIRTSYHRGRALAHAGSLFSFGTSASFVSKLRIVCSWF